MVASTFVNLLLGSVSVSIPAFLLYCFCVIVILSWPEVPLGVTSVFIYWFCILSTLVIRLCSIIKVGCFCLTLIDWYCFLFPARESPLAALRAYAPTNDGATSSPIRTCFLPSADPWPFDPMRMVTVPVCLICALIGLVGIFLYVFPPPTAFAMAWFRDPVLVVCLMWLRVLPLLPLEGMFLLPDPLLRTGSMIPFAPSRHSVVFCGTRDNLSKT